MLPRASGLKYKQVFENNMSKVNKPKIVEAKGKDKDFTRITFTPDLEKFGMAGLDDDIVAILSRRGGVLLRGVHWHKRYFFVFVLFILPRYAPTCNHDNRLPYWRCFPGNHHTCLHPHTCRPPQSSTLRAPHVV